MLSQPLRTGEPARRGGVCYVGAERGADVPRENLGINSIATTFAAWAACLLAIANGCTSTNEPSTCQGDEEGGPGCPCDVNDDCNDRSLECLSKLCVERQTVNDAGAAGTRGSAGSTATSGRGAGGTTATAGASGKAGAGEGGMSGGGTTATAGEGGMSGATAGSAGEGLPDPNACEPEPVEDEGVFISVAGADSNVCGTPGAPCRTFGYAFARAEELTRSKLYVGPGVFDATFTLNQPMTISGGWDVTWKRDCDRPSDTTLKAIASAAPSAPVISVVDAGDKVRFEYVTIEGKDASSIVASESAYALFVTGSSTEVELLGVELVAPSAGDGADGMNGTTPAAATGTCGAGTGAEGSAGAAGSAMAGTFTVAGYTPGDGTPGATGAMGQTGTRTLAQPGSAMDYPCQSPCSAGSRITLAKGTDGQGGCGGAGGGGGTAGRGGGSSVALYVWGAKVTAWGGTFRAGDGGDGGNGALGATGATGANGTNGTNGPTVTVEPTCCGTPTNVFAMGGTGMKGGNGGRGGNAGAGSGGSSYSIDAGGNADVDTTDTVLQIGVAGIGGEGPVSGLMGEAAPTGP